MELRSGKENIMKLYFIMVRIHLH